MPAPAISSISYFVCCVWVARDAAQWRGAARLPAGAAAAGADADVALSRAAAARRRHAHGNAAIDASRRGANVNFQVAAIPGSG